MDNVECDAPAWAKKAHQKRGVLGPAIGVFDKLDAKWKAQEAASVGALAAGFLAGLNFFWMVMSPETGRSAATAELLSTRATLGLAGLLLSVIAIVQHRAPRVWLAWLILFWSISDLIGFSLSAYGNPGMARGVSLALVLLALLGVRGAMRVRRVEPTR